MSLSRRSSVIVCRLRALCTSNSQSGLGSHPTEGCAFAATHTLFGNTSHYSQGQASSGYGAGRMSLYIGSSRNYSVSPILNSESSRCNDDKTLQFMSWAASPVEKSPTQSEQGGSIAIDRTIEEDYSADAIIDISAIAEKAALEAASEDCWAPTRGLQWLIERVHETTGLPWWSSIMLTTVGMRTMTFPVMLMQIKNTYNLSRARPEVEALVQHLKEEQARGNPQAVSEYQTRVAAVWTKYNANPLKSIATLLVQAPLFIGFFSALRALAAAKVPSLMEGGTLWFTDLTVSDPTYGLPVLASLTFLATVELGAADGMEGQPDKLKARMKNIMRAVALIIIPFSGSMPASVFMYWTASNFFSLFQTAVLKIPGVKPALGIPTMTPPGGINSSKIEPGKPLTTFTQKPKPVETAKSVAGMPAGDTTSHVPAHPQPTKLKTRKTTSRKRK